jgi:hypothetical protein
MVNCRKTTREIAGNLRLQTTNLCRSRIPLGCKSKFSSCPLHRYWLTEPSFASIQAFAWTVEEIGFTSLGKSRPHGEAVTLTRPIRHRGSQMCALLGAEGLPRFGWSLPLRGMSNKLSRKSHRCAGVGISSPSCSWITPLSLAGKIKRKAQATICAVQYCSPFRGWFLRREIQTDPRARCPQMGLLPRMRILDVLSANPDSAAKLAANPAGGRTCQ